MSIDEHGIGTYPVGILSALLRRRGRVAALRSNWRYICHQAERRNWRAIRNNFNGFLAEWHYPPQGVVIYRCGRGWTRRAAIRRLGANIAAANLSSIEAAR